MRKGCRFKDALAPNSALASALGIASLLVSISNAALTI